MATQAHRHLKTQAHKGEMLAWAAIKWDVYMRMAKDS